jgi:plasmid replication initiation protein
MSTLKKDYLVVKRNVLNEMRSTSMTLQELRLFIIYLSRINPMDKSTRIVRFPIDDFLNIVELSFPNIPYFKSIARNLLNKSVEIPTERGGFVMFNLFSVFKVDMDENREWYVEITATDEAMPLLFDYQSDFFKYQLWNALSLKSKNQLRMYEILKQYEWIGRRVITVKDLKGMLGINKDEYFQYRDFKRDVLEVCREALAEHTDITFTYKVSKRIGKGGKIHSLEFTITKNKDYKNKLELEKFINLHTQNIIDGECSEKLNLNDIDPNEAMELVDRGEITGRDETIIILRDIMQNEFTFEQTRDLYNAATTELPIRDNELMRHFLVKYEYAKRIQSEGRIKKSLFAYVKSIIGIP